MISALTITFCILYALFLLWCLHHWNRISATTGMNSENPKVSVVVPMRNEEQNILSLLRCLSKQHYKNFEIILCDDHSTDNTIEVATKWIGENANVKAKCIQSDSHSKKLALTHAIESADARLILTTDADCIMNDRWLSEVVRHVVQTGSVLVAGPVVIKPGKNLIGKIQAVEFAGLTVMGAAAIHSRHPMFCSGANLAFEKNIFLEAGGYADSKSMSGDDTQLLRKISKIYPDKIAFLKNSDALVYTSAINDKSDFFEQRKRWASKIPTTLSPFTVTIAAFAWLTHFFLLLQMVYSIFTSDFVPLIIAVSIKVLSETFILLPATKFMKLKLPVLLIILVQPFYALYIVLVGAIAPFAKFKWKGRLS
jgi:cellulose synthase/poly-beta-1,6-N-acetylglucosamine synthase-like glycosyltransferase